MHKKGYYIVCFLLGMQFLYAQQMPYINYTTHNGLPQIQVQELFQDSKGYIWVGTKGGLAQFNGEKFQHHLFNEYIVAIAETSLGEIYCLTHHHLYKHIRGKMHKIDEVAKWSSLQVSNNRIWVHQRNKIVEYRKDTIYNIIEKGKSTTEDLSTISYDKYKQQLLVFSRNSQKVYELRDKKLVLISQLNKPIIEVRKFDNGTVYCIVKSGNTSYSAINPYTKNTYFKYKAIADSIQFTVVNKLPVQQQLLNDLHPAYYQTYLIDATAKSGKRIHFPIKEEIYTLIPDKDQNYWAGTDNGLYQFNNKSFKVYPQLYMNDVWTMIKGQNKKYYAGIFKEGLFELDLNKETKKEIISQRNPNTIERDYYYGASKDKKGNLYFPTHYGLVKYNYKKAKHFNTGVCLASTYDTYNDKIVFGTPYGIAFIDHNENITTYIDSTQNYVATHPSTLMVKSDGDLFVGSHQGLTLFNKKDKQFASISEQYANYPKQSVVSMATDHKNNIWIGGKSELWLYNSQEDTFEHIGKDFFKTKILSLISPQPNLLLIGTSYEIFALRLDVFYKEGRVEYKMFNYRNGFFSQEVAQNAFLLDGDRVLIPSATTTSALYYKNISFTPEYFNGYVTQINNKDLSLSEQQNKQKFKLDYGENNLDIQFEAVGFGLPTQSRFKYKLEGIDEQWSNWSTQNRVYYSGLGSGQYTFHLMVQNGSNMTSAQKQQSVVSIAIDLPFYKEPHFYQILLLFVVLIGLLILYFIYKFYQDKLAIDNNERRIKLLEIATLQSQINPHFIFNFLSSIQGLISKRKPEEANSYLVKFSRLIRAYMESSIKSSKILQGEVSTDNENTIAEEINLLKTYIELEKLKYAEGKINYSIECEDKSLLSRTIPPMILQPFVENAIKHGILPKKDNGTVKVLFYEKNGVLVCEIQDNGIGRALSAEISKQSIKSYKSRGLELIRNRVEMLNKLDYSIKIDFDDPPKGGTIVIIKIKNQ